MRYDVGNALKDQGSCQRIRASPRNSMECDLFILRLTHQKIIPGKPWSLTQLQYGLRLKVFTNQVEHNVKAKLGRCRKLRNTSA
jgi:hypothetical protein